MDTVAKVAKNLAVLFSARVFTSLLRVLILGLLARYLGVEGFGSYTFIIAFIGILTYLSDFGLRQILVREVAKQRGNPAEYFGAAIVLKVFLSVILVAVVSLIVFTTVKSNLRLFLCLASFAAVIEIATDPSIWIFRGFERMEYEALLAIINRVLFLAMVIGVVHLDYGLTGLIVAILLSNLIRLFISFALVSKRLIKPKFSFNLTLWKFLFFQALPVGGLFLYGTLHTKMGIMLLRFIGSEFELGIFGSAFQFINTLMLIALPLVVSMFPVFSRLAANSKESFLKSYQLSLKFFIMLCLPITIGLYTLGPRFISFIFGKEFTEGTIVIQILSFCLIFNFLNLLYRNLLIASGKQSLELKVMVTGLLIDMILGYFLILTLSYVGAAITFLVSEATMCVMKYIFISKSVGYWLPIHKIALKPTISAILMGIIILFFREYPLFLLIAGGGMIYFAVMFILKGFSVEEIIIFKRTIKWGRGNLKD